MLRMDQVHVIRHKVLREGASIRQVARELPRDESAVHRLLPAGAVARASIDESWSDQPDNLLPTAHDRTMQPHPGKPLFRGRARFPFGTSSSRRDCTRAQIGRFRRR
jgi:hypothetical protein